MVEWLSCFSSSLKAKWPLLLSFHLLQFQRVPHAKVTAQGMACWLWKLEEPSSFNELWSKHVGWTHTVLASNILEYWTISFAFHLKWKENISQLIFYFLNPKKCKNCYIVFFFLFNVTQDICCKVLIYNYVFVGFYFVPNLIVIMFNLIYPVFLVGFYL